MLDLYAQTMDLTLKRCKNNRVKTDRRNSFPLMLHYARRDVDQEFAVRNEVLIRRVLRSSARRDDRRAAAYALGYAPQSKAQVLALVHASRDPDDGVRNNAVRALGVLATSSKTLAAWIPAGQIVSMLNSGLWADRNKAAFLMNILTASRDPRLLRALRSQALPLPGGNGPLKDRGHAWDARMILGRRDRETGLGKLATDNVAIIRAVMKK
jgi:hypothetical protein